MLQSGNLGTAINKQSISFLLVTLILFVRTYGAMSCNFELKTREFVTAENKNLQHVSYKSKSTRTHVDCVSYCHSDPDCHSVNYQPSPHICELNATRAQYPDKFVTHYGSVYLDADVDTALLSVSTYSSCQNLLDAGHARSGIYTIYPSGFENYGLKVYCDMDTDGKGWIVFQRRQDGSVDFYLDWADYQVGFGNLSGEFWLGNDNLRKLTESEANAWILRVDLEDWDNKKSWAVYNGFRISGELYTLHLNSYNAEDSTIIDAMMYHNNQAFTTRDQDNDNCGTYSQPQNCAQTQEGAWWYNACHRSNLNGKYYHQSSVLHGQGINWGIITELYYSFKKCTMKIRMQ